MIYITVNCLIHSDFNTFLKAVLSPPTLFSCSQVIINISEHVW